jgi:hypothetical protein
MTALFVIANEYREAAEKLSNLDLDPQTLADTLESLSGELEVKAQSVAYMIRNMEATASAIKEFEEKQTERRKAIEARAEGLKRYLQNCMEATGIKKIEGPGVVLSFRESSAVVIDEPGLIPIDYMRTPPIPEAQPDKKAIGEAIKAGTEVPGAHIEKRKNLQIK